MVRREPQLLCCAVLASDLARRGYEIRSSGIKGGSVRASVVAVRGVLESEIPQSINGICNFQLFPGTIPPRRARGHGSGRAASGFNIPSIPRDQTEGLRVFPTSRHVQLTTTQVMHLHLTTACALLPPLCLFCQVIAPQSRHPRQYRQYTSYCGSRTMTGVALTPPSFRWPELLVTIASHRFGHCMRLPHGPTAPMFSGRST